jgi:hypothetical protein
MKLRALAVLFLVGILFSSCKEAEKPELLCKSITEDHAAEDHCSVDKADCEKTLSKLLSESHGNRCPQPPCSSFSAWVECEPLNQDCELGSGEFGMLFSTTEHVRCR